MITCEQFVQRLEDLLDNDAAPTCVEARAHMQTCEDCRALAQSSRVMLRLLHDDTTLAMPEGASQRLRVVLERDLGEPLLDPQALRAPRPMAAAPAWWRNFLAGTRPLGLAGALVLLLVVAGVVRWRAGYTTTSGWLIDKHCLPAFASHPQDHDRACMLRCTDGAYGVLEASGQFLTLDASGVRTAVAALESSQQADHLWVTVKGRTGRDQVLHVNSLQLTSPALPQAAGMPNSDNRSLLAQLETDAGIRR